MPWFFITFFNCMKNQGNRDQPSVSAFQKKKSYDALVSCCQKQVVKENRTSRVAQTIKKMCSDALVFNKYGGFVMSIKNELQGVFAKGYGTIPKHIMTDPTISLEVKAIFAYFCALAGSGNKTFPYRSTIIQQLGLSKNTYYKHYNDLIKRGLISVKLSRSQASNTYTINIDKKDSRGFGIISREVMQDSRLSIKSKGLYAFLCSLSGKGNHSFPKKKQILKQLNLSEPTYYSCLNQLKECGFVFTKQRKVSGRFSINDYYLYSLPVQDKASGFILDAANREKQHTKNCEIPNLNNCDIPDPNNCDIPNLNNCDTYLITAFSNNNVSINRTDGTTCEPFTKLAINLSNKFFPDAPHRKIINEFLPKFRKNIKGRNIDNLPAYMRASINTFLAEISIKESSSERGASYDLAEIEDMFWYV